VFLKIKKAFMWRRQGWTHFSWSGSIICL